MSYPYTIYGKEGDQFGTTATQILSLGSRMVMRDGRVYRYCKNGASAINAGSLCRAATQVGNSTGFSTLPAAVAAGSTSVRLNATGSTGPIAVNALDEGYVFFSATGATGKGEIHLIYRMGSTNNDGTINSPSKDYAWGTATGTFVTLHLFPGDSIQNAWATSTGAVGVAMNKYARVVAADITVGAGGSIVGVPNVSIAADRYFWAQTWGPCPVHRYVQAADHDVIGVMVVPSTEAASTGHVSVRATATGQLQSVALPLVGTIITLAADTFTSLVDLTISP